MTATSSSPLRLAPRGEVMKLALARMAVGLMAIALGAIACRQNEPLDPKTPPNQPLPDIDRPDDPTPSPMPKPPPADPDGGPLQGPSPGGARTQAR